MNKIQFLVLILLTLVADINCINIASALSSRTAQSTKQLEISQPAKSTLVDLPYFNATVDREFLWEICANEQPYNVLKLAHFGSMRSLKQRTEATTSFSEKFSFDYESAIKVHEILDKDDFGELTHSLFIPKAEFFARQIRWAIKGFGTDEDTLTDILCCLDPKIATMNDIREEYKRLYKSDMAVDVEKDVGGTYGEILNKLIKGNRPEYTFDEDARHMAQSLVNDVNFKLFTDPEFLPGWHYFVTRSFEEIALTAKYFYEFSGNKTFLTSYLEKATSHSTYSVFSKGFWNLVLYNSPLALLSDYQKVILDIVLYSENKFLINHLRLVESVLENNRKRLTRVIAVHADTDLGTMKEQFNSMSGNKSMVDWLLAGLDKEENNDWYRDLVAKIIEGNTNPNRDNDWIKLWKEYERNERILKRNPPECWFGDHCRLPRMCIVPLMYVSVLILLYIF